METIILIAIGLVALGVILYMTFDKSQPACHSGSDQCDSCSLYRGCDKSLDNGTNRVGEDE